MDVIIMYRNNYDGGDGWKFYPMKVTINDYCPVCGEERGKPRSYQFHECGEWYVVDRWENQCGHIDKYEDCYHESKNMDEDIPECFGLTHQYRDIG